MELVMIEAKRVWHHLRVWIFIALFSVTSPVFSQVKGQIAVPTPTQLAQFPLMTGFQISPDGKRMLAIESSGDNRNILIWRLEDLSAKPTVIGAKNMQISSASFLKNDMLQVILTQLFDLRTDRLTKTFVNKLMFTDLEGKNWIEPMASAEIARSSNAKLQEALSNPSVLNRMQPDPDHVVLESDSRGETRDIFRYNVRTGAASRLMRLGESDASVWVNSAGFPWAKSRFGTDAGGAYVSIDFRSAGGEWAEHFRSYVKNRDIVDVVAFGSSPGTAIIRSNVGQEFSSIKEYDIASRKIISTLFEHKFFDAAGVRSLAPNGEAGPDGFEGYVYSGISTRDVHWERPEIDSIIRALAQTLGLKESQQKLVSVAGKTQAEVVTFGDVSVQLVQRVIGASPTYLFRVSGSSYPTEHYLLQNQKLQLLAKEYSALDRASLGTESFVYYHSRDGLNIPAYLNVPNQSLCGPGPYAAVIHPHGGPWARDTSGFDNSGWVPLMVSQCQVVLRPQFRGSEGWGRTLWLAGDREWGQKMQDDKDDGAKWLISQRIVDPSRIAMFGFSYGGYSAFVSAIRPNGLYKCAIAGAGVSDIERITSGLFSNPFFRDRQEATIRGLNPLERASEIKIPMMVYHGDRDQTVPLIQSDLFVERAKKSNTAVEYHVLKDFAHGPAWTRQTASAQLTLIRDYFKSGCGGAGL
jgi:dipeptidyl aminopeptidase/acylaminoacyl peptidase